MAGYLGNIPTAVPLTSADIADGIITSAKIADGTIVNADINASSAIALSKLSTTGTADATTFLRGDGAYTAVSSDFVLLASTTASSSASVSFDGYFSATYKNYMVIGSCIGAGTNNTGINSRVRRSNSDVTSSNYVMIAVRANDNGVVGANAGANSNWNSSSVDLVNNLGSSGSFNFTMNIFDPLNSSRYKWIKFSGIEDNSANGYVYVTEHFQTVYDNTNAYSGISFFMDSGNIAYGNFKLYGIK